MGPLILRMGSLFRNMTAGFPHPESPPGRVVRFATYNASPNREKPGDLIRDLSNPDNTQARIVAEIIRRARPDVLLVIEIDFDPGQRGAALFRAN